MSGDLLLHACLPATAKIADVRAALTEANVRGAWGGYLILGERSLTDDIEVLQVYDSDVGPLVLQFVQTPALPSDPKADDDDEEGQALVVDTGAGTVKFGFAGDDCPRVQFPTVIGRIKPHGGAIFIGKDRYVGDEAISKRGMLSLNCPIQKGIIINWADAEAIWHHTFYNEMRGIAPENHPILMTEALLNPKQNREKLTQMMFETFNVPSFYLVTCSVLALYASGYLSGVVLDSGFEASSVVPIYEGYVLAHAVASLNVGGDALTQCLLKLMSDRGYSYETVFEEELVNGFKEKHCYVALNFDDELKSFANGAIAEVCEIGPNGEAWAVLGCERIRCPEVLFQPGLLNLESDGIHFIIADAIRNCDTDIQNALYSNVVLAGGSTCFPGFADRLELELRKCAHESVHVRTSGATPFRYSAWIGGSVLAGSLAFREYWIKKEQYDEIGPDIVHRKCQ